MASRKHIKSSKEPKPGVPPSPQPAPAEKPALQSTGPPVQHRTIYALVTIALILLAFFAAEIALRFAEYGGNRALFQEVTINGIDYYRMNPGVVRRYFRKSGSLPSVSQDLFRKNKPSNTIRLFALGGSTTLGYPYLFNGSFPSMLKDRLETVFPEKNIEIVNMGVTAVNSHTLLNFTQEAVRYKPDAIIIYAGHNEFYGAFGVGSVEHISSNRWIVQTYLSLSRLKLFLVLEDIVSGIIGIFSSSPEESRSGTLMERMVEQRSIPYDSDHYRAGMSIFRENLNDIASIARQHSIPVVISTLVSNWKDQAPFVSVHASGLNPEVRNEIERLLSEVAEKREQQQFREALAAAEKAVSLDTMYALSHYERGRVLVRLKRNLEARESFLKAKDLDALRFRASREANTIIRSIADREGVYYADAESLLFAASPAAGIGNELILEHLHPNLEGYFLIAKSFAQTFATHELFASAAQYKEGTMYDGTYRAEWGVTEFDMVTAEIRLRILMNSWPFTQRTMTLDEIEPTTDMERLALRHLRGEITWEEAHVTLAESYKKEGNYPKAYLEYRALRKATSYNISPYLGEAQMLLAMKDLDRSRRIFRKSLLVEETFEARFGLGVIAFEKGEYELAEEKFLKALTLRQTASAENIMQTQFNLAMTLANLGRMEEARAMLETVLAQAPDYRPAKQALSQILRRR